MFAVSLNSGRLFSKKITNYILPLSCGAHKTALFDFHVANEGKMVEFAGYSMPVQYGKVGIAASHKHVRSHCGLFDVSHMLQTKIHGKDRVKFMESLTVADIEGLNDNCGTLSIFTNPAGGIIDDLICSKTNLGYLYVVSNAGCREKDLLHMKYTLQAVKAKGWDVSLEVMENQALLALQGPQMSKILQPLVEKNLNELFFMNTTEVTVAGILCRVTRCGYTGEDGVEISVPNDKAVELCKILLENPEVELVGLGARDSLRLEAGLCLYGNDIDELTTPVEAGLTWTIGKRRLKMADFPGAEVILHQQKEKPDRRRIGLISKGPTPRAHCSVFDLNGNKVGEVTSGCPSPTLDVNVAMAYVAKEATSVGTSLNVQVRKNNFPATVSKMPFVTCHYHHPAK